MSLYEDRMRLGRDEVRRNALLRAHLDAGTWKAEAWALADSLSYMLASMTDEFDRTSDQFMAELHLAHKRLDKVRRQLSGGVE